MYCQAHETHLHKLQILQNRAARLILRADWFSHSQDLLDDLHWMNIKQRVYYHVGLLMFKAMNNISPEYLQIFTQRKTNYNLRPNSASILFIPQPCTNMCIQGHQAR